MKMPKTRGTGNTPPTSTSQGNGGAPAGSRLRASRRAIAISSDEEEEASSSQVPRPRARRGRGNSPDSSPPRSRRSQTQRSQGGARSQTQRGSRSQGQGHDPFDFAGEGRQLTEDEMVNNAIFYVLMMQEKLYPIRKTDLIKSAMNKQASDFREVIDRVADDLLSTFGLKLVGMKNAGPGPADPSAVVKCDVMEATAFILISKFRQQTITRVIKASSSGCPTGRKGLAKDLARATLVLILSCTYMLDKAITEDAIWELLEGLEIANELCKKKEDLRRFLKTEFLDTMYLSKHEEKTTDELILRYDWGFRAEQEFSKYAMLKYVAENILGKDPTQFPSQFTKTSALERSRVDVEFERMKKSPSSGSNSDVESANGGDDSSGDNDDPATGTSPVNKQQGSGRKGARPISSESSEESS